MELKTYITHLPADRREEFAKRCGTSWAYVTQIASGFRKPGAQIAVAIERETGGIVRVEELAPEIDWPVVRMKLPA